MQPVIKHFFHPSTFTLTYVVNCPETKECVVIDPVLDFDIFSGEIDCQSAQAIVQYIKENQLIPTWVLETHAHADHVTAAHYLKRVFDCRLACSEAIRNIQTTFKSLFNFQAFNDDGRQFDRLLHDKDKISVGNLSILVIATPGHTPDSLTYVIDDHAFVGDTLFMPDSGSARCDFPDGSAAQLFHSIQKIYALGDNTTLYMCHDYQPNNRELKYCCTVAEQKRDNIQISHTVSAEQYIERRQHRDAGLAIPRLIYPSLQLNINAGQLPESESNQQRYLKLLLSPSPHLKQTMLERQK